MQRERGKKGQKNPEKTAWYLASVDVRTGM